jgi:hypothetical protein
MKTQSKALASTLVLFALALGSGCGGGGDPCVDLVNAVNQASTEPGCANSLAQAKAELGMPSDGCSMADDATLAQKEAEALCFAQVTTCDDDGKSLRTLNECVQRARTAM